MHTNKNFSPAPDIVAGLSLFRFLLIRTKYHLIPRHVYQRETITPFHTATKGAVLLQRMTWDRQENAETHEDGIQMPRTSTCKDIFATSLDMLCQLSSCLARHRISLMTTYMYRSNRKTTHRRTSIAEETLKIGFKTTGDSATT